MFYWHVHHTQLFEACVEPIERRLEFIRREKPREEVETRLRLIRPVKNERLLQRLTKYQRDFLDMENKIYAKYGDGLSDEEQGRKMAELNENRKKYEKAGALAGLKIEALHRRECAKDCPWDGQTIFPGKKVY